MRSIPIDDRDKLESQIRQTSLLDRLDIAQQMIGRMCSERRPPKMSIPVNARDEDLFIYTTLRDAIETIWDYLILLDAND